MLPISWKHESADAADCQRSCCAVQCHCISVTASVSLHAQGPVLKTLYREHCSCSSVKQRMCSCESNAHCISFVFSRDVQITFYVLGRKGFFKELHIQIVCLKAIGGVLIWMRNLFFFVYSSITVIFFFNFNCYLWKKERNNWSRGAGNGTGKKTAVIFSEKPFGKNTCFLLLCQHRCWQCCSFPEHGCVAVLCGVGWLCDCLLAS